MHNSEIHKWIEEKENRKRILKSISQPLTAKQIARRTRIDMDTCSYVLGKFKAKVLVTCLNPQARNSRLYYVTPLGRDCQRALYEDSSADRPQVTHDFPSVNWDIYGWICFSHRAAIIRILDSPMQPSAMKRRLRNTCPNVTISANNIRDIIRLFLAKGIVQRIFVRRKAHPRYELTGIGTKLRQLLSMATMPACP